jgi:hypothetical protein
MHGVQLALQAQCHTKMQRAPNDIFRLRFPFLKIFLTLLYSIKKTIMGSSVEPSLRSCALAGEKIIVETCEIFASLMAVYLKTLLHHPPEAHKRLLRLFVGSAF